MKVKNESEVSQLSLTLSKSMDCNLPGSSVHGIFQARVLEWGAIAFSDIFSVFPIKNSIASYADIEKNKKIHIDSNDSE